VFGLPGSGKTTFSQELVRRLMIDNTVAWFNADIVRRKYDDWDFTPSGRRRQVDRMTELAANSTDDFVVCDFVCPTDELRDLFAADVMVWMDTITHGRFEDTNKIFEKPKKVDFHVTDWSKIWVDTVHDKLISLSP
jgi:hypothetical protein